MSLLALDSRWRRLNDPDYTCPCCGQSFGGLVDLSFDHPDPWPHEALDESGEEMLQVGEDALTAELCVCEGIHFLRALLPLPVRGGDDAALFAIWVSVTPEDYAAYVADMTGEGTFSETTGWLMTDLPEFASEEPVSGTLTPSQGQRPRFMVQSGPLLTAQRDGIAFDALLDLYAACGTDIRPHLMG